MIKVVKVKDKTALDKFYRKLFFYKKIWFKKTNFILDSNFEELKPIVEALNIKNRNESRMIADYDPASFFSVCDYCIDIFRY